MIHFDKIFIIILRERQKQYAARGLNYLINQNIDISKVEFIDAVRGDTFEAKIEGPVSIYGSWALEDSANSWWNRPVTRGEIGCALSHLMLWRRIANQNLSNVLILEEDFKIKDTYHRYHDTNYIDDYDIFYYGRNKVRKNFLEKNVDFTTVIPGYSYCTHAYALSLSGARKLAQAGFENNLIPVDEFLNLFFIKDHPRQELYNLYKIDGAFKAFAFSEDLIGQTSDGQTAFD